MDIRRLSRLLGVGSSALPETSALDEEGLRVGAALEIIRQGGDLEQFAGDRAEMLALMMTVTKRGLIAWNRTQARYDLTRLGEAHLRTYYAHPAHPPPETESDDEAEPLFEGLRERLSDLARGALAGAATLRRTLVSAVKGAAGSRRMMSGKTVALLAGAAAIAGVAAGASLSSLRLGDRASRADAPPVAAIAGAPAGRAAEAAPRTAQSGTPPPAPATTARDNTQPVPLSDPGGAAARGSSQPQVLAGGAADKNARKPVVASVRKEPAGPAAGQAARPDRHPPAPSAGPAPAATKNPADKGPANAPSAAAHKQALAQIMAALDRHHDQTAAETEGTRALALQDTPDDRRLRGQTPKAAAKPAKPAAKRADAPDRPPAEPPVPGIADARPPVAETPPPPERNPWMARQNRPPSQEWTGWPPSDGDCDLVEPRPGYSPRLSYNPYGWYGGPYGRYAGPYDWRGAPRY
jgi:hypothetical protein